MGGDNGMTSTVAVQGRTSIYPSGLQTALTLKNVGSEILYVDYQSNVNEAGFPLGIGSSMVWDSKRPLFAYAVNGSLLVSENAGNLFDAQAVAQSIVDGGLAGDIAQQIAVTGVPTLRRKVDIANGLIGPTDTITIPLPGIYSAIEVSLFGEAGGPSSNTTSLIVSVNDRIMKCVQRDDMQSVYTIPADSEQIFIATNANAGNTTYQIAGIIGANPPKNVDFQFYGGMVNSGSPAIVNDFQNIANGVTWRMTAIGSQSGRLWVPFVAGDNYMCIKINGGSSVSRMEFNDPTNGTYNVVAGASGTGGSTQDQRFVLPPIPLNIYYSFASTAISAEISLMPVNL